MLQAVPIPRASLQTCPLSDVVRPTVVRMETKENSIADAAPTRAREATIARRHPCAGRPLHPCCGDCIRPAACFHTPRRRLGKSSVVIHWRTDQTLIFHFFEFAVKLESPFLSPNAAPSTVDFSIESRQPSLASHSLVVPVDAAACRSALTRVKRRAQAVMLIYSSLDYAGLGRGPLLAGIKGWRRRRRRKVCSKLTQ